MSDQPIIEVENLGKRYRLGAAGPGKERYTALRDVIAQKVRGLIPRRRNLPGVAGTADDPQDFWALKEVAFSVQPGEVVGIIGRNGAGKSTLLKILSRITEPTEGRVTLRGRVASLLEVGTGFHPELTGRENIFLNGSVLGMHRREIKAKFDEIVAFAEVERFLDTPVKRYSSGMYVRLAFAVAAHLEPEILIVDEVLAVGDAEFQKKCLGKMQQVAKGEGRTVLFVSHNLGAVQSLCTVGVLLVRGKLMFQGQTREVVKRYLESHASGANETAERQFSKPVSLIKLQCSPSALQQWQKTHIDIELGFSEAEVITDLALLIHAANGERAALIDMRSTGGFYRLHANSRLTFSISIEAVSFVEGDFSLGIYINAGSVCQSFMDLASLTVLPRPVVSGVVPREPQYRGIVELDSTVNSQILLADV